MVMAISDSDSFCVSSPGSSEVEGWERVKSPTRSRWKRSLLSCGFEGFGVEVVGFAVGGGG